MSISRSSGTISFPDAYVEPFRHMRINKTRNNDRKLSYRR